jgi:hypothetical protein
MPHNCLCGNLTYQAGAWERDEIVKDTPRISAHSINPSYNQRYK